MSHLNWHFAIEIAGSAGLLVGLAIWMVTGALYGTPKRPRSDSEQQ